MLVAQGDRTGALAAYREGLDIRHALAAKDPGNTLWQRDVYVSQIKVGNVLVAQGDRTGALAAYRAGLDIRRALAAKDPGNTLWQRDVSVSQDRVGDVLVAQGDLAGALAAYREGLDIRRALAAKDPGNTEWQTDVVLSLWRLALVGDDPHGRWNEALLILNRLKSQGRLTPAQQGWIGQIEGELAKLARAGRQ